MPKLETESKVKIRQATMDDHKAIVKIAKQSKYTSALSNMIFSGEDCYAAGRLRVAVVRGEIVGFTCFRKRVRKPALVLYFVGVETEQRGKGIGTLLMHDLAKQSTERVEFNVMKDNPALRLYRRLGFKVIGSAYDNKAFVMRAPVPTKKPLDV